MSNAVKGANFEILVQQYFNRVHNFQLERRIEIQIGVAGILKSKAFDLGRQGQIVVECKSNKWTDGGNVPQAKLTTWNEAMYLFYITPSRYRKMFVVERYYSEKYRETLAQYYIRTYRYLIPADVEIWEFNTSDNTSVQLV